MPKRWQTVLILTNAESGIWSKFSISHSFLWAKKTPLVAGSKFRAKKNPHKRASFVPGEKKALNWAVFYLDVPIPNHRGASGLPYFEFAWNVEFPTGYAGLLRSNAKFRASEPISRQAHVVVPRIPEICSPAYFISYSLKQCHSNAKKPRTWRGFGNFRANDARLVQTLRLKSDNVKHCQVTLTLARIFHGCPEIQFFQQAVDVQSRWQSNCVPDEAVSWILGVVPPTPGLDNVPGVHLLQAIQKQNDWQRAGIPRGGRMNWQRRSGCGAYCG